MSLVMNLYRVLMLWTKLILHYVWMTVGGYFRGREGQLNVFSDSDVHLVII